MKNLSKTTYKLKKSLSRHQRIIFTLMVPIILIAVVIRVSALNNMPMDESYYNRGKSEIQIVNFNKDAISKIESLNDSNVTVPGAELPTARDNPFNEIQ